MRLLRPTRIRQPWQPAPLTSQWQLLTARPLIEQADPPPSIYQGRTIWVGWRGQYPTSAARPIQPILPAAQPPSGQAIWLAPPRYQEPPAGSLPRGVAVITPAGQMPSAQSLLGQVQRQEASILPKPIAVQGPSVPVPQAIAQLGTLPRYDAPIPPVDPTPRPIALQVPSSPVPSGSFRLLAPPRPVIAERVPQRPIVISGAGLPLSGGLTLWCVAPRAVPEEPVYRVARPLVVPATSHQPPGAALWAPAPVRQEPNLRTGGRHLLVIGVPVPTIGASVVWSFVWREAQINPVTPRRLHLSPRSLDLTLDARSTDLTLAPRSLTLTLEDRE
jgi:hypothetical protein